MNPSTLRPPSRLDVAICGYLALPVLVFCTWFRWPAAIAFAALFALGCRGAFAGLASRPAGARWLPVAAVLAIALGWTALAGPGHLVFANSDWFTRDAVLRDLVATPWPPAYQLGTTPLILRAPVGYYLPAALVGVPLGLGAAHLALYAWTVCGVALFLGAAATLFPNRRQRTIALVVLVAFSGLDLLGTLLMKGGWPPLGQHLEWWALVVQYSSDTTLLFWVPNHALPAWLGIVVVLRLWRTPALARLAPLFAAAVPLWSPLAAIGLAPFFVGGIAWRRDGLALLSWRSAWPWYVLAAAVAAYVTLDPGSIPSGWLVNYLRDWILFLRIYVMFCLLEFGLLALVLWRLGADSTPLRIAVVVLLLLPLYRFGQANDLPMRASIPALAVLALATVAPLAGQGPRRWRVVLALLLLVGTVGPAQEVARLFLKPRWAPPDLSMAELYGARPPRFEAFPPHYVARLTSPAMARLLREPALVPPGAVPAAIPSPASSPAP